ncbi:sensor histidine kinase [Miniphocaeibacter halophilus]|uniref:HAMP domain-containing histidine kinase n=1 Tax=Miniphocaeibacter halophilus TaxID=2931922 RepID=A0AC61MTD9_9FIRM|nr:HAMP domain-containing sensor histidine kinase [Miniphocaeibacter halophilus]QQK07496.1 HAMP domain-containing histidine kinase [Miniphocaeibacter halophilus]
MKISIKNRIVSSFVLLIIFTVVVFEIFSIYSVRYYYYYSVIYDNLRNEIKYSLEMSNINSSDYNIETSILEDMDQYYRGIKSQVQILTNSKVVIYDSLGTDLVGKQIKGYKDIDDASEGMDGQYIGNVSYSEDKVMSVSSPIKTQDGQKAIFRLTTSLKNVDLLVRERYIAFLSFGIFVILISIAISVIMSNNLVKPIKNLTKTAEKLAEGQLNTRVESSKFEEIDALSRTLNYMTDNIKEKEKLKNDFISSVSHELRTPLTSINGWATTLLFEPEDTELVKEGLEIIQGECSRLSLMVEELLDFSRFTSNRIKLEKEETDFTELAIEIKKQLTPRAKSLGIDLIINFEPEHIMASLDPNRMKQVLINLLDNALKFTNTGGVVILNLGEDEKNLHFEVIDTGVGIDSEEISLITGKFYKGKNSNSHTGLGLSICEEIVKLHNGEMMISSEIGEGTTIKISIPKKEE